MSKGDGEGRNHISTQTGCIMDDGARMTRVDAREHYDRLTGETLGDSPTLLSIRLFWFHQGQGDQRERAGMRWGQVSFGLAGR